MVIHRFNFKMDGFVICNILQILRNIEILSSVDRNILYMTFCKINKYSVLIAEGFLDHDIELIIVLHTFKVLSIIKNKKCECLMSHTEYYYLVMLQFPSPSFSPYGLRICLDVPSSSSTSYYQMWMCMYKYILCLIKLTNYESLEWRSCLIQSVLRVRLDGSFDT